MNTAHDEMDLPFDPLEVVEVFPSRELMPTDDVRERAAALVARGLAGRRFRCHRPAYVRNMSVRCPAESGSTRL